MHIDLDALFPEDECVRNGDPFLAKVVAWDEYLGDCENTVAERTGAAKQQQGYELRLLYRWYALEAK